MKTTSLVLIIVGILCLVAIVGFILFLKSEKTDKVNKLLKISGYLLYVIIIGTFFLMDLHRNYSLYDDQHTWQKYGLPQIDSNMHLIFSQLVESIILQ